jgi:hypothetical protein
MGAFVANLVHFRASAVGLVEVGALHWYGRWRDVVPSNVRACGRQRLLAGVVAVASTPGSWFDRDDSLLVALTEAA